MNYTGVREVEVVVIGAGQAGLAAAFHLRRVGGVPGRDFMELTGADPQRPSSEVIGAYFDSYEQTFGLRVRRPVSVTAVREGGEGPPWTEPAGWTGPAGGTGPVGWAGAGGRTDPVEAPGRGRLLVETSEGDYATRALINATGTWDRPFWPRFPGQETFGGRQLHSSRYPGPEDFRDARVVVVGGGTSAVQQLMEVAPVAAATTWVTRRPPVFREGPFGEAQGRAAVALVEERVRQGLPPRSVVSVTGLPMTEAMRQARESGVLERLPLFERITPTGVVWDDGRVVEADVILYATGFRAAIDHLAPLRLREPGGGIRMDGTRTLRDARVHLVGYGPSASTIGANRAGRAAVGDIRRLLAEDPQLAYGQAGLAGLAGSLVS
ncbi:NAD(P)-binding domain-containing protein [Streptomyces decoyicus]|uniref:NAD(P)-binding domain-containing protein n=1 Tax=Streptomyces decoyicus TaxID=249567 RepID=A0ABZ1FBX7_9ACTN|nr:NAD(P)-binding domain-containing protein [Streptomyces decoyicus]WSB67579.1 NAD(P)-binding domain-containing protein [Streptomyces decoyicus]